MATDVHFGVTLPQIKRTWQQARDAAIEFEGLGFDSLWVNDHLFAVPMPNLPIFEAWTELTAVAALTERVELGSLVTPPYFRNTAVFAKQLATLDNIAGGRVICGLGSGWYEDEFKGYGCEFPGTRARLTALEEMCILTKRLWTEETVTFEGEHISIHEGYCEPKPVRLPRILIGGGGEKVLMKLAARHADIWNNLAVNQPVLGDKVDVLRRHCDDEGRDPDSIVVSQQCVVIIQETEQAAAEAVTKAQRLYGGHMGGDLEETGIWGTPEGVIERIQRHVDLGCTMFVIEFFGKDTREPARLFAEHVMPAFRS